MDKQQARTLIEKLFTQPFDRERYEQFLRNLLNHIEPGSRAGKRYVGQWIKEPFKPLVTQYWCLGKYIDPDGAELDLLVVEIKSFAKLEHARSALRNFAISCLKQFDKDQSLIAFYAKDDDGADWRFSFVKREYRSNRGDDGKIRIEEDLTPARRYSYLVGKHEKSHTACRQLMPLLLMDSVDPHIEEIENAFSVETVTDEFFEQYKALYRKVVAHLQTQQWFRCSDEAETEKKVSRFSKKLLGQIVFLYFLQKKGWIGAPDGGKWGEGSKLFLRDLFDEAVESGVNYYSDVLCFLFYEALACERKGQEDSGYYERFDCRVPFLNGGLFEADYDWRKESIDIPDNFFHNDEKSKAGDTGTGILDVFDRYNFTIREDEPLDKEVAVDPEMLGKVFEKLLSDEERKGKGAFYTPREIVHYMCQESLVLYLDNRLNAIPTGFEELGLSQIGMFADKAPSGQMAMTIEHHGIRVPKKNIETLIRKGHLALEHDACVLDKGRETGTYHFRLPEPIRIHAKEIDAALADIKVCDPAIGSGAFPVGMLHEIVAARKALAHHTGYTNSSYALKRHAIGENLYGVDLDASAIDIARLRLWLSLIVDEEDYDTIEPLPNLDYKIIQGDSLIGIDIDPLFNKKLLDAIEAKKKEFFDTTDHDKKGILGKEIDMLIHEITNGKKHFDYRVYFSEVWHLKDGFDVVIGNPPYRQIQSFSGQPVQKEWELQKYETFAKTGDLYCLFYEKGYRLLRKHGVLAFITSNKWMRAAYGEKLRRFFSQKTQPRTLIDFSSFQVFDSATVDTNVLLFTREQRTQPTRACQINSTFTSSSPLDTFVEKNSINLNDLTGESWVISDQAGNAIRKRIEAAGTPLKDWNIVINYGIKTGFNEAFIIDGKKRAELIAEDPKSEEIIKPVLRGRDIKRYRVDYADLWLINTHNGYGNVPPVNIEEYPAIKDHLDQYWNELKKRQDKGVTPYNLRNCAYVEVFEKEKIVWGNLALSCQFALAEAGLYINAPSPLIGGGDRYLLAVLNSSVADYYIRSLGVTRSGGYFEYKPMFVEKLPVPQIGDDAKKPFKILADYVLLATAKEKQIQRAFFEQLIDGLVYELYFPDELRGAGKGIQPHIGTLIPFADDMSEEQKLAIIQQEFDRLYDPCHPVRNNIETLDSIDVVRTIRKALKR